MKRCRRGFFFLTPFILAALFFYQNAYACPLIGGLVDFNCDGKHKVVFIGDSFVAGVKDSPKDRGGYVTRVSEFFPGSEVTRVAVPGVESGPLLRQLITAFARGTRSSITRAVADADLAVIDVGRNDYWEGTPPLETIRNLIRIVGAVRGQMAKSDYGQAPPVVITTLLPTSRIFQSPFIGSVNYLLLHLKRATLPMDIRLDRLSVKLLASDHLHPSSRGYDAIALVMESYISGKAQATARSLRPDFDHDGVYDFFERNRYHTDPTRADTDGDGYTDGEEIFTYFTDPLNPSSHPTPVPTATETPTP